MQAIMLFRPLTSVTQQNRRNVFIMLAALMIVASSIVLVTVAFVQNDEITEADDFLVIEGWMALWISISFFQVSSIIIPRIEFPALVLCIANLGGGILAPPFMPKI